MPPPHICKIAAPTARRICHQQCKKTFSTASVKLGSQVTQSRLPLFPQQQIFLRPVVTSEKLPQGDQCTATWWLEQKFGPIVARAAASAMSRRRGKALYVRDFGPDEWRGHWALPQNRRPFWFATRSQAGRDVILAVGVALGYFFVARLSLALLEPADGVAVFWPAAGVASGILIALGSAARWPVVVGVVAATIAANLLGDRNIWSSVFFAVANAGEAVIVAGLIHRLYGSPFELNELRRVLALFAATVVGTSLSGIAGTLGFMLFHASTASPPMIWQHWFSSDALGNHCGSAPRDRAGVVGAQLPAAARDRGGRFSACCGVPRRRLAGFVAQ